MRIGYSKAKLYPVWLVIAVGAAAAGYLMTSYFFYSFGFPLDDAWIHQTYARNLGWNGEWAYLIGQPSAGSTSPLWTALLAIGYFLRIPALPWTYLLGIASLIAVAWAGEALFRDLISGSLRFPLGGLFLAGEWHLVWASASGMETLVNAALALIVLRQAARARGSGWVWIGLLIGAGLWVRPDALTFFGPALVMLILKKQDWKQRFLDLGWLLGGAVLLLAPYLLFNLYIQGSIWPNTFYAKQAEYAILRDLPILERYWSQLKLPLIGSGLFVFPGFLFMFWRGVKEKNLQVLSGIAWFLGYALLYAVRLPVTYQYGRYLIPAMPVYFILGLAGTVWLARQPKTNRIGWVLLRVAVLSAALVWLGFYLIGANRYASDVTIIETEMVASARWVAENTPPGSMIAAHDIGAIGYFSDRPLVDLAGLISPEVIPIIQDEGLLAKYLDETGVQYLVVLEGWYPHLAQGKELVYRSKAVYAPAAGGSNMLIYKWDTK